MPENRTSAGRFIKGVTGNPGGRPAGFAARIREATKNGEELVEVALDIMRGKLTAKGYVGKDAAQVELEPTIRERLEAVKWLADRGFGRVVETQPDEFSALSDDELIEMLQSALAKRRQTAPSTEVSL